MRRISFERFSSAQRKIEGGAEGSRSKQKASKKLAAERKESDPQILRTQEEIAKETEGVASAKSKKEEIIDLGDKKVKKEYLELEEDIDKKALQAEKKRQKDDPMFVKPDSKIKKHRKGVKPPKVYRDTIREDTDIEEAA